MDEVQGREGHEHREVFPGVVEGAQRPMTPLERSLGHSVQMWQVRHQEALKELRAMEAALEATGEVVEAARRVQQYGFSPPPSVQEELRRALARLDALERMMRDADPE